MPETGPPTAPPHLRLELPAAAIQVFGTDDDASVGVREGLLTYLADHDGVHRLANDLLAVLPSPGDPAVIDAALAWCREAVEGSSDELRVLIFPIEVREGGGETPAMEDSLAADFADRPPALGKAGVYLSSRALLMLDEPVAAGAKTVYEGSSGRRVPLFEARARRSDLPPWRNPELLNRRPKNIPRPALTEAVEELLNEPAARVTGVLGCGKSRLVATALGASTSPAIWVRTRPARRGSPDTLTRLAARATDLDSGAVDPDGADSSRPEELVDRIVRRAAAGSEPLTVVIEDAHHLSGDEAVRVGRLIDACRGEAPLRVVLVARPGVPPPIGLADLPEFEVPLLSEEELDAVAAQLTDGLSVPTEVKQRLVAAAAGCPLALEEGLFALAHRKILRQVYGGFFFAGGTEVEYAPSPRLVSHLHAEAARLGSALAGHLLAVANDPLPDYIVTVAAEEWDAAPPDDWHLRLLDARLLTRTESAWGDALEVTIPAFRAALAAALPGDLGEIARRRLGEILAEAGGGGESSWRAYRLLASTDDSLEPLLEAAESSFAKSIPRGELLEALAAGLERLGEDQKRPGLELRLLWKLLPLARRMGRLHRFGPHLARGVELSADQPARHLALASLKAELDQEEGRYEEAERTLQGALRSAAGADQRRQALLMIQLGRLILRQDRYAEARRIFDDLRQALQRAGLAPLEATCRFYLGNIALREGRLEAAEAHHEAALELRLEQHLLRPLGSSYSALGAVAIARGNYRAALDYYRRAEEILAKHGREGEESFALLGVGRALTRLGDFTAASASLRRSLELRTGRDDEEGVAIARLAVAENYLDLESLDRALEEARAADFKIALLSADDVQADSARLLGRIFLARRSFAEAKLQFDKALGLHRRLEDHVQVGVDHSWRLELALAAEDIDGLRRAAADLKETLDGLELPDRSAILNWRLYRGLEWLRQRGHKVGDPRPYLERAYRQLLDRAAHLVPEHRHRFLSQIADHRRILEEAAGKGLTTEADGQDG